MFSLPLLGCQRNRSRFPPPLFRLLVIPDGDNDGVRGRNCDMRLQPYINSLLRFRSSRAHDCERSNVKEPLEEVLQGPHVLARQAPTPVQAELDPKTLPDVMEQRWALSVQSCVCIARTRVAIYRGRCTHAVFTAFSGRVSTRWSIGMIPPSF